MKPQPLMLQALPELSDETAAHCLEFLQELTTAFENYYAGQLRRYYEPNVSPHPDLFSDEDNDDTMPF